MRAWVLIVLLVLGLAFALWLLDFLDAAGVWVEIEPHFEGTCEAVPGVVGAEDIVVDRASGMAFLSSFDRRAAAGGEAVQGAIYGYDLKGSDPSPVELTGGYDGELRPHGISVWRDADGVRLFVVNHAGGEEAVEIFAWDGPRLHHLERISGELLASLNDVVAVGPRSFYVTNDHGGKTGIVRTFEDYLRLPLANVVFYDGERFRQVVGGIAYANGINKSPDGDEIYVAATTGRAVHRYLRDTESGDLRLEEKIDLRTGADNIDVDRHGNLWVAAHPKMLRFLAHAGDPRERSPSQVLWLEPYERQAGVGESGERFLETYVGDGGELSGSSVAVPFGSRLLIGSVFEEHFLLCRRG